MRTNTTFHNNFLHLLEPLPPLRQRSQTFNPKNRKWVKRDKGTGLVMWVKKDGAPFKRVPLDFCPPWDLPPAA
jgi:hypothetical protein